MNWTASRLTHVSLYMGSTPSLIGYDVVRSRSQAAEMITKRLLALDSFTTAFTVSSEGSGRGKLNVETM